MPLRSGFLLFILLACTGLRVRSEPVTMPQNQPVPPSSAASPVVSASAPPAVDRRLTLPPVTLNTSRAFPALTDKAHWQARRARLRQQILVSCGLYPLPPKTPLRARIFDRVTRDGYTIEKVVLQTYPGFYLAGNLYRPSVEQQALRVEHKALSSKDEEHPSTPNAQRSTLIPHPAILIAHGHWPQGRLLDEANGSIPARAITFARQGYVAFTYDMVGYNDTRQIGHTFAGDHAHWLWGVSLMGLQTWNSLRALDFLAGLPDVDKTRLAMTGESGGGTQTLLLGVIDDRLAALAPCVMVSHTMQGGCLCENAPGLRVDFSNMELAAAFAPKPQIMVGATGDWTKTTMTVEGPSVAGVYALEGRPDNLRYEIVNAPHNINKTSREIVYRFLGKTLLHDPQADAFTEPPYKRDPIAELRVFPDNTPLPADAKNGDELGQYLKTLALAQIEKAKPHDARSLAAFKRTFQPAWERTLNIELPDTRRGLSTSEVSRAKQPDGYLVLSLRMGRTGRSDSIPVTLFVWQDAPKAVTTSVIVLAHPRGRAALLEADGKPGPLVKALLAQHKDVAIPDVFLCGERADAAADAMRRKALDDFGQYFTTYNRTDTQERVQDILTVCAGARQIFDQLSGRHTITLAGMEQAGAWAMLAADVADAVAADCGQLDTTTDDALLSDALFVPGLRRMGDFRTALTLAAPHPLLLHNVGPHFPAADWLSDVYAAVGSQAKMRAAPERLDTNALAAWLVAQ